MYQIPAHFVKAAIKGAVKLGFCEAALLANAGIDTKILSTHNARVSHQQLATLFKTIWKWTEDEFMGLGRKPCTLGYFRLLTTNQIRSSHLQAALNYAEIHYRVTRDDAYFRVEHHADRVHLIHHVDCIKGDDEHLLNEYYLLAWQRYLSWLIKKPIQLYATHFNYEQPKHSNLYTEIFSGKLKFAQEHCALVFSNQYLTSPIVRTAADVTRYVNSLPLPVFSPLDTSQPISSVVKNLLHQAPASTLPNLTETAIEMELNPRTLHRKLLAEGTHFQEIKDRHRYELAIDYLMSHHLNITRVAELLGFSEAAAFCHFFKKMAGISPTKYIQLH